MGKVVRAWDEDLERWVAIKFIRADRRASDLDQRRFHREARTVARLNHPAIVQVYQRLRWEDLEGIVMELVDGETLADLLDAGPLAPRRALPLLRQIADGLAHAHGEGFVHRDLKTANIMVTRAGRAKILDFGLAKGLELSTLSETGAVFGTPHTMSPEQAQGLEVDFRSDLFSLGVLIYETLSGDSPFRAESSGEVLGKVIHHHPPPLGERLPETPAALSRLVERLMAKAPAARPASAAEVAGRLRSLEGSGGEAASSARRAASIETLAPAARRGTGGRPAARADDRRGPAADGRAGPAWRRRTAAATALVVAVALALALWQPWDSRRPIIAVADFENRDGDAATDWRGLALADALAAGLTADRRLRLPWGGRRAGIAAAEGLTDLKALADVYGIDVLIVGSHGAATAGPCELQLRALSVPEGESLIEVVTVADVQGPLLGLGREVIDALRASAGAGPLDRATAGRLAALYPDRPQRAELYARALEARRRSDPRGAHDLLVRAVAIGADLAVVHGALAASLYDLGRIDQAAAAAERALARSTDLPSPWRHELAARYGDEESAARLYRETLDAFPDEVQAGLDLARLWIWSGETDSALALLDELRRRPAPLVLSAELESLAARALFEHGVAERALDRARDAVTVARRVRIPRLEAEARLVLADILADHGRSEEAVGAYDEAIGLFDRAGDRQQVLYAAASLGIVAVRDGRLAAAQRIFEDHRRAFEAAGDRRAAFQMAVNLANVESEVGSLASAIARLEEVAERMSREGLGEQREAGDVAVNLGGLHLISGNLAGARERYLEAATLYERLGDEASLAHVWSHLGELGLYQLELDEAERWLRLAHESHAAVSDSDWLAFDRLQLARVAAERGQLDRARSLFAEALAHHAGLGATAGMAGVSLERARFELRFGNAEVARTFAQEAVRGFLETQQLSGTIGARAVLVRSFLESFAPDAERAAEVFRLISSRTAARREIRDVRMAWEVDLARALLLDRAEGDRRAALEALEEVALQARAKGYESYVREAERLRTALEGVREVSNGDR